MSGGDTGGATASLLSCGSQAERELMRIHADTHAETHAETHADPHADARGSTGGGTSAEHAA